MNFYIYKSVRKSTGEYYIGKRCFKGDIQKDKYMGSGFLFRRKYNKDPSDWDKKIVKVCRNRGDLSRTERRLIGDLWKTDSKCLNLKAGGDGGGVPGRTNKSHPLYNTDIHNFYLHGELEFTGTASEWRREFEFNALNGTGHGMKTVIRGERFSCQGWSILKEMPKKVCTFCKESSDPRVFHRHNVCKDYYNNFIYRRNT